MSAEPVYAASIDSIREAAERIRPHAQVTPVLTSQTLDALSGKRLFFKAEVFQKGGAFKFRGACNAVLSLSDEEAQKGVVTHSSGNHAAAVALAARLRGITAHIVVPRNAPKCKQEATRGYGGNVVLCNPLPFDERANTCTRLQQETGATFIPPYDYGPVIAGQGTIGLEFVEQVPDLDAIVVPISGGGMICGIAVAAKALKPDILIIAAEPSGSNNAADAAACKAAGRLLEAQPKPITIADGLQARLGQLTWPIVRDLVDAVVVISDDEIVAAMKLVMERMKVVVEPSGAAGLAAALSPRFADVAPSSKNVGIILCGGNLDFEQKGFWRADNWAAVRS